MPRVLRIGLVALVLAAVVWAIQHFELRSYLDVSRLKELVASFGALGPVVFIGIFLVGLFLPGPEAGLVVLAGVVFSPVEAVIYSWIAAVLGTAITFTLARTSVGDLRERGWNTRFERLRVLDDRLQRHGFLTVVVLRLLFFLAPVLNWALGATRVRMLDYVAGTAVGLTPGILVIVALADRIARVRSIWDLATPTFLAGVLAFLVFLGFAAWAGHRILQQGPREHPEALAGPETPAVGGSGD